MQNWKYISKSAIYCIKSCHMKQLFILIALAFTMNAGAQTTAVTLQHGKYINKQWKYNKPLVTSIPVVFDYPCVTVGDSTYKLVDNIGVMVVIEASHECVSCRGLNHKGAGMITSEVSGVFANHEKTAKQEVLSLIKSN